MNSRQRFLQTFDSGVIDRVPLFGEGMRPEVYAAWEQTELRTEDDLPKKFTYDRREEIFLDVEPAPVPKDWPVSLPDLEKYRSRLNPDDPHRLPAINPAWKDRQYPLLLRVHEGFFLSMGVEGHHRFNQLMYLCIDQPDFVRAMMELQGAFVAQVTERLLRDAQVDAVIFSEPIGGNSGALISPKMYEDLVIRSYRPVMDVVARHNIKAVIWRTYANTRALLPLIVDYGFNCLWACESGENNMDYLDIRQEFGDQLRLIGGLDTDVLLQDQTAIQREVLRVVPPLLEQGGYFPLLDGRVREYIPYENYQYYRNLLEELI